MCVGKIFLRSGVSVWKKSRGEHRGGSSYVRVVSIVCFCRVETPDSLSHGVCALARIFSTTRANPKGVVAQYVGGGSVGKRRSTSDDERARFTRSRDAHARGSRRRSIVFDPRTRADTRGDARASQFPPFDYSATGTGTKKRAGVPSSRWDASSHATGRGSTWRWRCARC